MRYFFELEFAEFQAWIYKRLVVISNSIGLLSELQILRLKFPLSTAHYDYSGTGLCRVYSVL
jgi:hypothetical protein